ncbi:MFS transporter [Bacillus sp. AFS053548]|uniref:MFS transporter n=1 Tax=Bacillus sp. AFS053548 TaxID=2033505 RepID=UPI000BFC5EB1|nr:MFS transporter [Bacillus sp. AFS053548]PGM55060.1 MFS transporter [Bacillus sp. AFS053548]
MNRLKILAFIFVLGIINFADKSVAGFSAVPIMKEFRLSYEQWGIVGSSFFWFFSIAGIFGGALSDRIGTKKMLAILAVFWSIVQVSAFFITGFPLLILSRVMLGIGEGPFYATAVNHLSNWFSKDSQSFALSILNLGNTIGALVSAPILVAIISSSGWRMAYGSLGLLSMIWFFCWVWFGREKPNVVLEKQELRPDPLVSKNQVISILRTPTFIFSCLASFSAYWMTSFSIVWLPSFLVQTKHFTQSQMSYAIAFIGILGITVSIITSRFVDQLYKKNESYRKSHVFIGGFSLIFAGILTYFLTIISSTVIIIAMFSIIQGLCILMFGLSPQIVNSLLPSKKGFMSGLIVGISSLAGTIGSIVTGKVIQSAGTNIDLGYNHSILLSACFMLFFGVAFLIFVRPENNMNVNASKHQVGA